MRPLVGQATDYSDMRNWLHVPAHVDKPADTFFIYPTVYTAGKGPELAPIDDRYHRAAARATLAKNATPFESSTNVFAPYYRQSALDVIAHLRGEELVEYQMAQQRTDIYAALDYYFEHMNGGRPFILAGHSQGSIMVKIVLREYMRAHPNVYERMIATYAVGFAFTLDDLQRYPHLRFAERADDTGVIVSWNTEGPENAGADNMVLCEGALCINPINWRRDEEPAPASDNLGSRLADTLIAVARAIKTEPAEPDPASASRASLQQLSREFGFQDVQPGIANARVDLQRGVIICTSPGLQRSFSTDPNVGECFGPMSYHSMDMAYYFGNVRQNVQVRIDAFLR